MKTKNVKVRLKDVKAGLTMYVSHPVYGIEKFVVIGRPFQVGSIGLFVDVKISYGDNFESGNYINDRSLSDMGITSLYNDRRTFFKLKHAKEWQNKWSKQEGFIRRHEQHEQRCKDFAWPEDDYYGYDEGDDFAGTEETV